MEELRKIRQKIRRGDLKVLGRLSGFSYVYIRKVLSGKRNNEKILKFALLYFDEREKWEVALKKRFEMLK